MQKGRLTVVSVEFVEEEVDVYDISVEADHSFLVHGAVLHNCGSCAALDGKRWTLDGEPIGHGIAFPGPALHWADRCTQLPVTKSWETLARENGGNTRLARELDAMDASTRASMDGQVSSKLTYEGWFAEQSAARQEDILGPARFALYKRGKLSFGDLVDGRGNPLTLEELSRKY